MRLFIWRHVSITPTEIDADYTGELSWEEWSGDIKQVFGGIIPRVTAAQGMSQLPRRYESPAQNNHSHICNDPHFIGLCVIYHLWLITTS